MPWWGWAVVGILLLGAELTFVDAQFYLVFIGVSALLVAFAELLGFNMPVWIQYLTFAVLSIVSMVMFRQKLYVMVRGIPKGIEDSLTGESVVLTGNLAPGDRGRVQFRGSDWTVINIGEQELANGTRVLVDEVDGTILKVSKAE